MGAHLLHIIPDCKVIVSQPSSELQRTFSYGRKEERDEIFKSAPLCGVRRSFGGTYLVHVEFCRHGLHLFRLLPQVALIHAQLVRDFRPGLPRQNVLQLDVQFLLLLDQQVLLDRLRKLKQVKNGLGLNQVVLITCALRC